jgi:hypothetical protein
VEAFTDEILAPTRTTRSDFDPVRDWAEVVPHHDELLVVTEAYDGDPRPKWCKVVGLAPGSASVYPYKVQVPERGVGQFAAHEVLGWRRPVERHRILRQVAGLGAT